MTDVFSPEQRSRVMAAVRGKDTKPEMIVRRMTHGMGYRFRLHSSKLPGKPDLVFPRLKKVIFVHGCFWHQHKRCRKARRPTSNVEFWNTKLDANENRDNRVLRELRKLGWKTLLVWECEVSNADRLFLKLGKFLKETDG